MFNGEAVSAAGDRIYEITLHRPQRMNAINSTLVNELAKAIDEVKESKEARVVVIKGSEKYFSAGADISEISQISNVADGLSFIRRIQGVFGQLGELSQPVLAAVSGVALGGGCELALACDLRIASETASFGVPEINIGVIPGAGGTQRLPRLLGICKAKELLFTGKRLSAQEALAHGLVNQVVPVDQLDEVVNALAEELAQKPPLALAMAKHVVNSGAHLDMEAALRLEAYGINQLFLTEDKNEGMKAFLEKRGATFRGR